MTLPEKQPENLKDNSEEMQLLYSLNFLYMQTIKLNMPEVSQNLENAFDECLIRFNQKEEPYEVLKNFPTFTILRELRSCNQEDREWFVEILEKIETELSN